MWSKESFAAGVLGGAGITALLFLIFSQDAEPTVPEPSGQVIVVSTAPVPATLAPPPTPTVTLTPGIASGLSESDPLRFDGIGGLAVGMTVEQAEAATGFQIRIFSDFSEECGIAEPIGGPPNLSLMLSNGVVVRVQVYERSNIVTEAGVGIGDTDSDVLDVYGTAVTEEPHPYLADQGSYLVYKPDGAPGFLVIFETQNHRVTSFRSGYEEQVRYIEGCA